MMLRTIPTPLAAAAAALSMTTSLPAGAVVITYPDFSSSAGLTLNGAATTVDNGIDPEPVLRLVPAANSQSGSAFGSATVNAATFSTYFEFRITEPGGIFDGFQTGADGLVFVVQPVSSSIGGAGGGLGYQGISPSVGVEFDTWLNGWDPSTNHLGVDVNGSVVSAVTQDVATRFDDGNLWSAWVDYDGTSLEVRANQSGVRPAAPLLSYAIDIPTVIATSTAYIGFTAGTGGAYGNHDIVAWEYRDFFDPIDDGDGDASVPEPGILALLAGGLLAFGAVRRRPG